MTTMTRDFGRSHLADWPTGASSSADEERAIIPLGGLASADRHFIRGLVGGTKSIAGEWLDEKTALSVSAFMGCIRVLSRSTSQLPCHVFDRDPSEPRNKTRVAGHAVSQWFNEAPNREMTSIVWRETSMLHVLDWGNTYAEIVRDRNGVARELFMIEPWRVQVIRDDVTRDIMYDVSEAPTTGRSKTFDRDEMFHIPGFGYNGLVGVPALEWMIETLGITKAAESFGGAFFGNGLHFGGFLEGPEALSDKAYERLKKDLESQHEGPRKAWRLRLLEEGLKYKSGGTPPREAQMLELRQFQPLEICRFFDVPPHMIGILDRATFSNIEHQGLEFVKYTLGPWLKRWEQEIQRKLIRRRNRFAKMNADALMRGDLLSRYRAFVMGRNGGWLSANDVREEEDLNLIENGDIYLQPTNMGEAGEVNDGLDNNGQGTQPGGTNDSQDAGQSN